jgi:hydrogenase maturation protease
MNGAKRSGALVLGVGNLLWADEGFGVRCVEAFVQRFATDETVDVVEGGTQGLLLIPFFQARADLVLFDAVDFGDPPGAMRLVEGGDIPSFIAARATSLHQTGMADVLACADLLGARPQRALLIGVQPVELEDYGGSLTSPVRARVNEAVEIAAAQLFDWGYRLAPACTNAALFDPSLALQPYEEGRPDERAACRIGDARVLAPAGHWG